MNQIIIADTAIRQDAQDRYFLNDLHNAAGGAPKHKPSEWLRNQQTQELVAEISKAGIPALETVKGGNAPGTYVCKEMVYTYAMWISPAFHLKVIRAYDALMTPAPHSDVAKQVKSAINARAWALSQRNYDTFRSLLMQEFPLDDPASVNAVAHWQPPTMLPASALDQAISALSALKGI